MTNEKKPYWANAIGFIALCATIILLSRQCSARDSEIEKTKQLEIIHSKK